MYTPCHAMCTGWSYVHTMPCHAMWSYVHTMPCHVSMQVGVTLSLFLGPFIIHSDPSVCGEDPPASSYHSEWSQSVNQHLSYYLMGQAILSTAALIATLFGVCTHGWVGRIERREAEREREGLWLNFGYVLI